MKLRKDKWERIRIGEICILQRGLTYSSSELGDGVGVPFYNLKSVKRNGDNSKDKDFKYFLGAIKEKQLTNKDDILIALTDLTPTSELIGSPLLITQNEKTAYSADLGKIDFSKDDIIPFLCYCFLQSNEYRKFIKQFSQGTNVKHLKISGFYDFQIPLPPLEEQKQIAELFQSIENVIEQVDGQERNLKSLQKNLVDGLMKPTPEFGNLLNDNNCKTATFEAIAECDKKYPEHNKEVERFIGLENIEPENFQIQGFGLVSNGTTFTKRFAKGDVLFGKRRAYLKKVAVADFDGICSGDIIVIRSKGKSLLQGLLPYYISSEAFIYHAVSTSAGSLSPRTKWKDLAEMEVCIPDIKTQEKILEVFAQIDLTMKQLKQQKQTLKNLKQKLLNEILG
ncbi:MAG TPA: restriction endonuclease subunit S [Bacteroidales bacterium]|nr:restriction endonuclease subunit S [Bacteroidales bacterium]